MSIKSNIALYFQKIINKILSSEIANLRQTFEAQLHELQKTCEKQIVGIQRHLVLLENLRSFNSEYCQLTIDPCMKKAVPENVFRKLRSLIREAAGLNLTPCEIESVENLLMEINVLKTNSTLLKPIFSALATKRILFAGQAYYNTFYLSRALRNRGWRANVLNWDTNPANQIYYHGEDYIFNGFSENELAQNLSFYVESLYSYDIFHFSNTHGISFGGLLQNWFETRFGVHSEINLLKHLGKIIVYTNNGCMDGVSQTAFAQWGPESVCSICRWRNEPTVCSDERNLQWGAFRNSVADFQCTLGGNRIDYNNDPKVHEVPGFYCLEPNIWHPEIVVPDKFLLPSKPAGTVWLYHAVGNREDRTGEDGINIKSSHVYIPLIKKLVQQGMLLELISPTGIPNKEVRFLQVQMDIFLDMLTFGWFGANAREAMMLGKPVICFIRPEWLESVRQEIPEYAEELPIVSATPDTVEDILIDLINNPQKRNIIGQKSREFAVKWHSSEAGARRMDEIYTQLLLDKSSRSI